MLASWSAMTPDVVASAVVEPLLEVRDLRKYFSMPRRRPWGEREVVRAVDGVSFSVQPHETLGLVGESGCGKTTTARMLLRLETPSSGEVVYKGRNVGELRGEGLRAYRGGVQAVFQDPWSSLNPRIRAGSIIAEPLVVNEGLSRSEVKEKVGDLLTAVGLEPALAFNYPHEFSGGMRQRVAVARALSLNPDLIVLDEPVSALDVSIRAQIMNLLRDLQEEFGVAYLLIAHDLATVRYLSHWVAVMYLGQIVELARSEELFSNPLHPYTEALISAALPAHPRRKRQPIILTGEVPSPTRPPSGCRFHTRCPVSIKAATNQDPFHELTITETPELKEITPNHFVRCHQY
jgi:oligopeptide/dipeptide ABC transporter ATP-binding protein